MKIYLLSDDPDTVIGLRLAGVQGKLIKESENVLDEIGKISADSDIGMILITPGVAKQLGSSLTELKKRNIPLISEIPDSNPEHSSPDNVTDYIRNAVGVKI